MSEKRFVMHETPNTDTCSLDDTNNELLSILFQRKEDCEPWLNLLNEYEENLQMCHEKALYWRNKAENIFGDMKTNVKLQQENIRLKQELEKYKS